MGTRIRTHITPKMRIISFVLAFVMVFVGLPYIGNNMKVKATTGSAIEPTSTTSSIKINGKLDGDGYIYTGKIKPITVDLFDYKTDREINGVTNPLQDGAYTYYNRYNPYHLFDTAISNNMGSLGNTTLPASENITIVYKSLRFTNNDSVRVHLWNDSNATTWPGLEMNYDSQDGNGFYIFSLTFNVGFLPDHLIFSNNGSDLYKTLDISQSMQKGHKYTFEDKYDANGHTGLIFRTGSISDATVRIHLWKDSDPPWNWNNRPALGRATNSSPYYYPIPNLEAIKCNNGTIVDLGVLPKHFIINDNGTKDFVFTIEKGYTYIFTSAGDLVSDQYPTKYPTDVSCTDDEANASVDIPVPQSKLYLGNFLARISAHPETDPHNGNAGSDNTNVPSGDDANYFSNNPANYNDTGASKGHMSPSTDGGNEDTSSYDAFYWQANIAQRPNGGTNSANRPKASIQGLVDQTLTNGIVSQNGIPLPYFNPSGPTASYMTVYQSTPSSTISFPFYEVLKNADGAEGYVPGTYSGTEKARYYEFRSKDANLIFDTSERKFKETDTQIQAATGTVGYFPFNSNNSPYTDNSGTGASGKGLNYGFGTKFEMTFKLKKDGMVPAVTDQGKTIKDEQNPSKVATYFEFEGDDDLWVFIDGNLVLDMGGSHAESKGYINFKEKTATVTNAVQYGAGGVDNVGLLGTEKTIDITSKINKSTTNDGGYDEDEIHTMTIFYMERGMAESNLLIRYNFPPEPNFHKMKVREETDFSNVNEGLKDLTMIAAETDVFKYKIENNGTKNEDVLQINAPYPTTDNYIRQVADDAAPTKLTSSPAATPTSYSFQPRVTVDGNWHDVKNVSYEWVDEYAKESSTGDKMNSDVHASGITTSESNGGYMYLMYGTPAGGGAERVKSSGEFEGQFARYSLMRVTQQEALYTPSTHVTTGAAATLNTDKYVDSDSNPAPRFFSTYYNLKKNYIFSTLNKEELGNYYLLNTNGQEFRLRNNIEATSNGSGGYTYLEGGTEGHKDANEKALVVMTVQFVNAPKVGSISITKQLKDGGTSDDAVTMNIKLTKVFGIDGVDVDDYSNIVISGSENANGKLANTEAPTIVGTFDIKPGNTVVIDGIPVGTKYEVTEVLTDEQKKKYNEDSIKYYKAKVDDTEGQTANDPYVVSDEYMDEDDQTETAGKITGTVKENYEIKNENDESYDPKRYKSAKENWSFVENERLNNYITLTKTDTSGNAITSSPATYYLLKLNGAFDTAYENNPASLTSVFDVDSVSNIDSTYVSKICGPYQTNSEGKIVIYDTDILDETITDYKGSYFFFEEQAPYGYSRDNALTYTDSNGSLHSKIIVVDDKNTSPSVSYPNSSTTGVSIHKTNEYGEGLENGEFDLYYKQNNTTKPPPTYSYNKPETSPVPEATTKINRNTLTVPEDAAGTSSVTTYTYEYSYPSEPSTPSSTEEDWILPRSDNDYIYFRDYNTGTVNNKDTEAFFYQDYENNQKRYWINTWLTNNDYGQNEEIGYDHRYKIKAQFTKNGSDLKEYEAWERFVDEYTDTANNSSNATRKTVVWKIQPPDGYNKVRFCLYDGGQCIRTTQEFSFVLGNIYTKTGHGNGDDNKWNYPVTGEHWSRNWNGVGESQSDKRMDYNSIYSISPNTDNYVYKGDTSNGSRSAPVQTKRYIATEQKIVFQCNSKQVWHNIHIEFFSSDSESDRIGQGFPGYMMEPYAFVGNDYRMKGYLTYELTIPKGATHFRINNGVLTGNYAYKTKITALKTETNKNNYGNFFKFPHTPQNGSYNTVDLSQWTKQEIQNAGDKYYATYNTAEVESDYDYIYFRLPSGSGWSNHVYAYFYGGGDLRAHNWQRGVYSIWPGVAPVATEYSVTDGTYATQHSDHYTYEYTQTLFSETPESTGHLTGINPESTFQYDGGTVYKFKIPKSERVTYENNGKRVYDKVIFNDGFKKYSANTSTSSNNETGMIGFKAGYIYSPDYTTGKKYYGDATSNYTGRGDYLYINNAADWDNLHVTFYNASGTAIWQGGTGYIMQYEGTNASGKYYRIPIPSGAAKFKLNNGKGGASTSEFGVIYPKQSQDTSKKDYTTGDMIYTLNADKSLEKIYPIFNTPQQVSHTSSSTTLQANYVTRGDKLYIRNTANWSGMNIGAVKIKFYDSSNAVIGTGEYTMIVSETESASVASDNRTNGTGSSTAAKWYSIDIPMNAAKFQLTSPVSTAQYDIYERINSDGSTDRNFKWTKGGMYYETSGTNALTLLYPTYYQSVDYTATDTYSNARGDNLYLVVSDLDKWENMRVTFYDGNGTAIKNTANDTAIVPNYIGYKNYIPTNSEAAGYWFKIAIPTGAESFRATSSASNSDSGDIYELSQNRTYHFRNDYTPGDMQYRITDTLSGGTYNLSLMYPIFTEEPFYSLNDEVNSSYPTNNITVPTPTSGTNDSPILYETNSDTITYTWQETTGVPSSSMNIKFLNNIGWSEVWIHYYGGSSTDTNVQMTKGTQNGDGYYEWYYSVPTGTDNIQFHSGQNVWNGANQTGSYSVSNNNIGNNSRFLPNEITGFPIIVDISDINNGNGQYHVQFTNSTTNATYSKNNITWIEGHYAGDVSPDDQVKAQWFEVPSGYDRMQLRFGDTDRKTNKLTLDASNNYGRGKYYKWNSSTNNLDTRDPFNNSIMGSTSNVTGTWSAGQGGTTTTTVNKTATYQPEDRYGMISNLNSGTTPVTSGLSDTNNFINVVTNGAVTKPYIKFYASDGTTVIGGRAISLTARLNGSTSDASAGVAQPGDGSSNNPYKIRLPKNAKSVELYDDSTKIGNTITLTNDGGATLTVSGTGSSRTVSKTSTTKNSTALQSGVSADEGFIFYKGNIMTHAYYYGGVDGEFCAWPGVPYSYTYTDGGDTVYAFQIPTTSNSTSKVYPYVIFNDGTANSGTNMTVAINYAGKEIYQDSNASGAYGSWSAAPKTVTHTTKTTSTPQGDPEDTPPEYAEIHLATIVTGADGRQKYIKWLKPKPGAEDEVDTEYLDHVFSDIGKYANKKEVRVKKLGDYYWVETVAPAGYKTVKDKIEFTLTQADTATGSVVTQIVDEPLPGKALLMKTAKEKVGNTDIGDALLGAKFKLTTKADLNTAIKVARKTHKSEYYVIPTDDEEYVALSRSGEYDTDGTVSKTIPDTANPSSTTSVTVAKLKEYNELVTDENGYIKIENLVWGDYVLTETAAPHGYSAAANGTTNTITFTVGKNNSDITQELSLKDEMEPSYIKLFEHINERKDAWGDPTFTFRIKQTHEYIHTYDDINDTWTDTLTEIPDYLQKEVLVSLTVNDDGTGTNVLASSVTTTNFTDWLVESTDEMKDSKREYQGMYHIDSDGRIKVEPGTYEITRMPVSRYEFVTSAYTNQYNNGGTAGNQTENLDNNNAPLEKVTISGLAAGKTIDVHYYDKVGYYDKFSQVDTKINKFYTLDSNKNNTTVKGIRIDDYYVDTAGGYGTISGDTLTIITNDVTKFKAYKIMADGTEQQITGVDLAKFDISYNYESGSKDDEQFATNFSYINPTITVNNASRYHDSVYKLNVSYDNKFTTTFNLVFEKQSTNVTYYTAQVIFKNDSQDSTSHDPSNISYFEEGNNRTHAYEFTFVIADDGTNKTVSDIRHNGTSVGTGDTAWSSALSTMNSSFNILSGYSYSLDSWVQLTPSSPSLTSLNYIDIEGYLKGSTPGNIEFAAYLTSS